MINFPTFPFMAALRASTGASSNSFFSLLYAWTKHNNTIFVRQIQPRYQGSFLLAP